MDLQLHGRPALVLGASRGLGRAVALGLAQAGASVTAVARTKEDLSTLLTELEAAGGSAHRTVVSNLLDDGAPRNVANDLLKTGPVPEIIVYNIGGSLRITDPLASAADYQRVWQLNVGIAIECNAVFIPELQKLGRGRIVHISSAAAETCKGYCPYSSAKAALNGYVRGLAKQFAKDDIVISAVAPGALFERGRFLTESQLRNDESWQEYCRNQLPIGRVAAPEEIVPFILLLSSPLAAYACGSVLGVDGAST